MNRGKTLRGLDSVRVLTHPLRQRILGLLIDESLTIRELAERLGLDVHPLYHHIRVLHENRMIRIVGRRQRRGAVERRYRATASSFSVSPASLLATSARRRTGSRLAAIAGDLAAAAVGEVRTQAEMMLADAKSGWTPLLSQVRVRGSRKEIDTLRRRIHALLEQFQKQGCDQGEEEYELTLFFYPKGERRE